MKKISVVFFQRKPRKVGNYSVEFIFDDVRRRLVNDITATISISTFESSGFFKRFYNCIEAFFRQGIVNHVTGDINYLGLFLRKRKTIHTILDCVFLTTSKGFKYKILKMFWLVLPEKNSTYLTAISESTKKEILRHHQCDPDKIIVIPVAISPSFKYRPKEFNTQLPRILQLGTAPNKNVFRLIEALSGIPCVLNIVGRQVVELEDVLKKYNVKYIYERDLTEDEILERYYECDIVSLASTYEGFGMPILEGQAVGRPVLTSNILSMPEVARDGACLVDPYNVADIRNGILKITNNKSFRNELIKKGIVNCRRFDPQTIANEYLQLYKKISDKSNAL